MPPHNFYVEPFLGGGAVLERKIPAPASLASDIDADLIRYHQRSPLPAVEYCCGNAIDVLADARSRITAETLIYLDPPYPMCTRSGRRMYAYEMSDADHFDLLHFATSTPAQVMISGYRCQMYDGLLSGWHRTDYQVGTRGRPRIESLWTNFEPGRELWDTRFVGDGYRERERIKRKRQRWVSRFVAMGAAEREVIRSALMEASTIVNNTVTGSRP